ncbi:MAG: glycosyltransferase family 2 protein, partial [Candidatus Paceibacterota bacterium]
SIEALAIITGIPQEEYVNSSMFGATANLFVKNEVFKHVPCFNENRKSGADAEFGRKVVKAGYQIIYCKNAYVLHPARDSLKNYIKKSRRIAGGKYDAAKHKFYKKIYLILHFLIPPPKILLKIYKYKKFNIFVRFKCILIILFVRLVQSAEVLLLTINYKKTERS